MCVCQVTWNPQVIAQCIHSRGTNNLVVPQKSGPIDVWQRKWHMQFTQYCHLFCQPCSCAFNTIMNGRYPSVIMLISMHSAPSLICLFLQIKLALKAKKFAVIFSPGSFVNIVKVAFWLVACLWHTFQMHLCKNRHSCTQFCIGQFYGHIVSHPKHGHWAWSNQSLAPLIGTQQNGFANGAILFVCKIEDATIFQIAEKRLNYATNLPIAPWELHQQVGHFPPADLPTLQPAGKKRCLIAPKFPWHDCCHQDPKATEEVDFVSLPLSFELIFSSGLWSFAEFNKKDLKQEIVTVPLNAMRLMAQS